MKKLDTRLLRLIKDSKGQFISITITIVLALTIYVSFSMVSDNLYNSIFEYYDTTNFGDVFVEVSRIPKSGIDKLHDIEGVKFAQGRIVKDVPLRVEDPNEKVNVRIVSIPTDENRINSLFTIDGEDLKDDQNSTVVLQQFFDARNMKLKDTITPYIGGKEYNLEIKGVVGSPEYIYLMENEQTLMPAPEKFGVIYISEKLAQTSLGYQGSYNEVMIKIDDKYIEKIDIIVDEIEDKLDKYGVRRVIERENQLSHNVMMQEVESLDTMATAITLMFLIVAGIIINIMISRIVRKDRISIGIMKALGYSNLDVLSHYTKYSILIGLVGSIVGIILSIPLSRLFTKLYIMYMNIPLFKMKIYYIYFLYGIILTSLFCIVSGLMGARSVIKILPADSMREEAPKIGSRIWIEKIKFIWTRISFSWKIVIRNIFRNKKRALFLIIGIALTYSITMVPIFMSNVWDDLFTSQYGEFQTMDYNIDFALPMNRKVLIEISQMADIDYIEPKAEVGLELRRGWRKKAVSVIGLERDTKLYNFKNLSGDKVNIPRNGILLSQILADVLHVNKGDKIWIKNYMPGKDDISIEVKGIIQQNLGSNAYVDIETMNSILGEKALITGAILNSKDEVINKLNDAKNISQIQSTEDMKNSILEFMDMIIASMGIMMMFGGILGFAIVYNVTIISISERKREFSSLRVLGFGKRSIYKLVSRENSIMTVFGLGLGVPLAYGLCISIANSVSTEMYSIPVDLGINDYIVTAIATIVFVIIAQIATIRKINKLDFIKVLKDRTS